MQDTPNDSSQVPAPKEADTLNIYKRQHEHLRLVYEEEAQRADRIVQGAKMYLGVLLLTIGTFYLKGIPFETVFGVGTSGGIASHFRSIGLSLAAVTAVVLFVAFSFALFVFRVWGYERLCNPKVRLLQTGSMMSELDSVSKSMNDFAEAAHQNYQVNNRRAKSLHRAMMWLYSGVLLTFLTMAYFSWLTLKN